MRANWIPRPAGLPHHDTPKPQHCPGLCRLLRPKGTRCYPCCRADLGKPSCRPGPGKARGMGGNMPPFREVKLRFTALRLALLPPRDRATALGQAQHSMQARGQVCNISVAAVRRVAVARENPGMSGKPAAALCPCPPIARPRCRAGFCRKPSCPCYAGPAKRLACKACAGGAKFAPCGTGHGPS